MSVCKFFLLSVLSLSALYGSPNTGLSLIGKHQTPVPYAGQRNWHVTQNLGATGARGWMLGERGNTTESREILIRSVNKGSPSDGVLKPYDVILGIDKTPFNSDARIAFAKALTKAEGTKAGGKLKLLRWRDGTTETVTLNLPIMGDYSSTAPMNCQKTDKIVAEAAQLLHDYMPEDGFGGMTGALNALLLLATENPLHLDHVRRTAMNMGPNHTINDAGHETWRWGYANLFLCEYYLATGDKRVLPTIKEYCDVLTAGQCYPGTWGHRSVPDGYPPGYGSMNQSGIVCFLSMILAYQCGVEVDEKALANCINFYGRYAGWGGIPYGDHPAYMSPSSNGKNGSSAVAFFHLGGGPSTQWFARSCVSTNLAAFEDGHTGNYFNQIWTPIGASLAGDKNYQNFWKRLNHYRDLARFWKGGFLLQSAPQYREGDLASGQSSKGPMWSTGGFTLGYLGRSEKLAILGRKESVFGNTAPGSLRSALDSYHKKDYKKCLESLSTLKTSNDSKAKMMSKQLERATLNNLKSRELTLATMNENLKKGDLFLVQKQLQAIEYLFPNGAQELVSYQKATSSPEAEQIIASRGHLYQRIFNSTGAHGPRGFWTFPLTPENSAIRRKQLRTMLRTAKGYYLVQAKAAMEAIYQDEIKSDLTKPLTISHKSPVAEQKFSLEKISDIEDLRVLWSLSGKMKVTLNDTLILDLDLNMPSKDTELILKPSTLELLKVGENTIKVIGHAEDKKLNGKVLLKAITNKDV